MALTERKEIGKMEILPDGIIQVRTDTVIERDGVEVSRAFHRHVVQPSMGDADRDKQDPRVQVVMESVHTAKVKSDYITKMDAINAANDKL